jgi:hypothetical protein
MRAWIPTRREIVANVAANIIVYAGAMIVGAVLSAAFGWLVGLSLFAILALALLGIGVGVLVTVAGFALYARITGQAAPASQPAAPCATFADVARRIKPLLDENRNLFERFGPNSGADGIGSLRFDLTLWERAKADRIVPNNEQIRALLAAHRDVIPMQELPIVKQMEAHIFAFHEHVANPHFDYSAHQFPRSFRALIDRTVFVADVADWLTEQMSGSPLPIVGAVLFGSILQLGDQCGDVDLMVIMAVRGRKARAGAVWLADLRATFRYSFRHELHVTAFVSSERRHVPAFLAHAGEHKLLIPFEESARGVATGGAKSTSANPGLF